MVISWAKTPVLPAFQEIPVIAPVAALLTALLAILLIRQNAEYALMVISWVRISARDAKIINPPLAYVVLQLTAQPAPMIWHPALPVTVNMIFILFLLAQNAIQGILRTLIPQKPAQNATRNAQPAQEVRTAPAKPAQTVILQLPLPVPPAFQEKP
uniref:Transmembrane domain-containing protein n=1 Tax=Spironucleus salmonicida TaxID=348837 RepID=V6LFT4_9EUKA|eukprot:EST43410.1 Transmembrane domain-containing protein [Spironucleus salmonicida]